MRTAYMESSFIENGKDYVGVNLGFDFCAEHEFGIKYIEEKFGLQKLNEKTDSLDRRTIKIIPNSLGFFKIHHKNKIYYVLTSYLSKDNYEINKDGSLKANEVCFFDFGKRYGYQKLEEKDLITAWDEKSFAIMVKAKNKDKLQKLYDAFMKKDIVIFFAAQPNPFGNRGLCLAIKSLLPAEIISSFKEEDEYMLKLENEIKKANIEKLLKDNNKGYLKKDGYSSISYNLEDGKLKIFIYPMNRKYNSGWFDIEDIYDWIKGTGKIVK